MTSETLLSAIGMVVSQELRKLVQAMSVSCPISSVFLITSLSRKGLRKVGNQQLFSLDIPFCCVNRDLNDALYPYEKRKITANRQD